MRQVYLLWQVYLLPDVLFTNYSIAFEYICVLTSIKQPNVQKSQTARVLRTRVIKQQEHANAGTMMLVQEIRLFVMVEIAKVCVRDQTPDSIKTISVIYYSQYLFFTPEI